MHVPFIPRSIRGRLFLAALAFTGIALLFASVSISTVFDRFARHNLNDRLDGQLVQLARTVRPDGSLDRAMLERIGPFTAHRRGWGWRIDAPGGSAGSRDIRLPPDVFEARRDRPDRDTARRWGVTDRLRPDGLPQNAYIRTLHKQTRAGPAVLYAYVPDRFVQNLRRTAILPWAISLTALAAFLLVATLLQLRIGLAPLARLRTSLQQVRAGQADRLPEDQPMELRQVAHELNGLLDENEAALARARGHVANLAHSLKTPLATLELRLREDGRDRDGELTGLVAQIDSAIRHHLGRARAASPGAPGQRTVSLPSALDGLLGVLSRIHAERGIHVTQEVPRGAAVKCDPQDLDEMLGNLLDNAWKWARSAIHIGAATAGQTIIITIEDDGPGLPDAAIDRAMVRGERLDEQADGHGFGLPIARELAELHGGSLTLGRSALGGLRVDLTLPR